MSDQLIDFELRDRIYREEQSRRQLVPPPVAPEGRAGNPQAVAALVLGTAAVVCDAAIWLFWLGVPAGVLAATFGGVALRRCRREPGTPGRGMAIAGLACGAAAVVLGVVGGYFLLHVSRERATYGYEWSMADVPVRVVEGSPAVGPAGIEPATKGL